MKKVLLSLAAVSAIAAAAVPAAAAADTRYGYGYQYNPGRQINERQAVVTQRINSAISRGHVTRWEAQSLVSELRNFERTERQYRYGGLAPSERATLDRKLEHLENSLMNAVRDAPRTYGYGYGAAPRW